MRIFRALIPAALAAALVAAAAPAFAADALVNTLRWKAHSEKGTYGYLIYRADQATGPFRRLNDRVIRAHEDSDDAYTFGDRDVVDGRTYYYRIDAVSDNGLKKPLSPVLPKVAGGEQVVSETKSKPVR